MKYLPFEHIIYKTKLNEEELLLRLESIIEEKKIFRFRLFNNNESKPYEGQVEGNTFKISRIINYRNSFLPVITGMVEKSFDHSTITVKMRLNLFVLIFLIVWFSITLFGSFALTIKFLSDMKFDPMYLIPFGMLIFGYLIAILPFKFESKKSKNDFKMLFEAEIIKA